MSDFIASAKESGAECSRKAEFDTVIDNPDENLVLSDLDTDYVCQYVSENHKTKAFFGANVDTEKKIEGIEGHMMFLGPISP